MKCAFCGNVLNDGENFCSGCGAPVADALANSAVPENQSPLTVEQRVYFEKLVRRCETAEKIWAVGALLIVVVCIGGCAFFFENLPLVFILGMLFLTVCIAGIFLFIACVCVLEKVKIERKLASLPEE